MMRAIITTYRGPTERKGSKIKADAGDGVKITVPYDHSVSGDKVHFAAVKALCEKMNWKGRLIVGGTPKGNAWVWLPPEVKCPRNALDVYEV